MVGTLKTVNALAALPGEAVLIIGIGVGKHIVPFREAGKIIIGSDILPHYHTGYEHILGDYEQVPFGDDQFDLVLLSHTLEHMLNPGWVLQKIKKELKTDGWLGLCLPGKPQDEYHAGHLTLWTPMHITGYLMAAGWDCTDVQWYTTDDRKTVGYLIQNVETPPHSSTYALGDYYPENLKGKITPHMSAWQEDRWF